MKELDAPISNSKHLLTDLANAMLCDEPSESGVDAGLTYFGQFISHDLVPPRGLATENNGQYPFALNLNSLYGNEPDYKYELFPEQLGFFDSQGLFLVVNDWDLFRAPNGKAIIPEQRNDENLIIAQFHRLMQEFHNHLIRNKIVDNALCAKTVLTQLFQLLTVEYFLDSLLDEGVCRALFKENKSLIDFDKEQVPTFFSHAAFRFGHSMVRSFYNLNHPRFETPLDKMFKREIPIAEAKRIDWNNIFNKGNFNSAHHIDTFINEKMGKIPFQFFCGGQEEVHMPSINLKSGQRVGLKPGSQYVNEYLNEDFLHDHETLKDLGLKPLTQEDFALGSFAKVPNLNIENLPLWPYILLEAQVNAEGKKLGVLGSVMVGSVMRTALINTKHSIMPGGHYSLGNVLNRFNESFRKEFEIDLSNPSLDIVNLIKNVNGR